MSAASVIDLVAGSAGGAAAIAVGQPLDTIKVRERLTVSSFYFVPQSSQ